MKISSFPWLNFYAKYVKSMQGSLGQEWASKLATNIKWGGWGASLKIFVTDCLQIEKNFVKGFLKTHKVFFEKVAHC